MAYEKRIYRHFGKSENLVNFEIKILHTDLYILAEKDLTEKAEESILKYRSQIEGYIRDNRMFLETLKPLSVAKDAPCIIRDMAEAGSKAGVGPMAAVAGAIAESVGSDLLNYTKEVIVENGGDIFIKSDKPRRIGLFTGNADIDRKLIIELQPSDKPQGICTSSGKIGPSLSFGNADAVTIIADRASVADAFATAVGNMIKTSTDIQKGIAFAKNNADIKGLLIVIDNNIGIWGKIKLAE